MPNTHPHYLDEPTAKKELDSFLIEGKYGRKTVPTRIDPAQVEKFIRQKLDRKQPETAFAQSRRLVDYYDLHSVLDHYQKMLNKQERDANEFNQSCRCVTILAEVGDQNHNKVADAYFEDLVKHKLAMDSCDVLLETLETLDAQAKSQALKDRLGQEMKSLEARAKTDPEADDQYQRLDQCLNNDMPRVLETNQLRYKILAIQDPAKRINELCRLYCGWERDSSIELDWWAARWIRREVQHRDLVLDTFRKIVREVEEAKIPEAERAFPKLRALRAIKFLGGGLTQDQTNYLAGAASSQIDVLYREP